MDSLTAASRRASQVGVGGVGTETQLESKTYGEGVVAALRALQQEDELCDFTVCAGTKSIRVHKVLLSATSEYFRAMLRTTMRESKEDSVVLHSLTAPSLQALVDFIYSGRLTLSLDRLPDIVGAANHLQVSSALDVCSDYIISLVDFSNANELVQGIAETYSLTRVLDFYHNKVLAEFEDFAASHLLLSLDPAQFCAYLASDSLRIRSEPLLLDHVARWLCHDPTLRAEQVNALLARMRWGLFSKQQLADATRNGALSTYPALRAGVTAGFQYHNEAVKGHPRILDYASPRAVDQSLVLIHAGSAARPFEITAFDRRTQRFHQLAVDTTGCRDCRVVAVDDFAFVCRVVDAGGGTLVGSLLRFDARHLSVEVLPSCRRLRLDPAVAASGGRVYVFGGCVDVPHGAAGNTVLDSTEVYDVGVNRWSDAPAMPLAVHSHASCTLSDGTILISGGVTGPDGVVTAAAMLFDPSIGVYAPRAPMRFSRRLHEMVRVGGAVFALGGIDSHTFHNARTTIAVERYDVAADQWTALAASTLAGRSVGHFVVDDGAILSLGREHHLATEEDLWRYDAEGDAWRAYARAPARASLAATSAVTLRINFIDEKVARRVIVDRR